MTDMTPNKPNAGRIYDYVLGGTHNFEADRQAADKLFANWPYVREAIHQQRQALKDIAKELTEQRGFDIIIDFASGLPTQDHIHHNVPEGTVVIYSDRDPITIETGQKILADAPNAYYFEASVCDPKTLLENPEVLNIIGERRNVAVCMWGVSMFITEECIRNAAQYLYNWTAPNSCLVFNAQLSTINPEHPSIRKLLNTYEHMGSPLYSRPPKTYEELLKPWKVDEGGFIALTDWHAGKTFVSERTEDDIVAFGPSGAGHGAYLVK